MNADDAQPDSTHRLELLFERPGLPKQALPVRLAAEYAGDFGVAPGSVYANFVSSLDGVVALPQGGESGQIVSKNSAADHFVMGLLRASADAVLLGAGTFRRSPTHLWCAESIFRCRAAEFAELRRSLGLAPTPRFVLVTGSGELDLEAPALKDAWLVTTREREATLRARAAPGARVIAFDTESVHLSELLALLRAEGLSRVLTEGGPSLVGQLIAERQLDELFVTLSPALFGRFGGDGRKAIVDAVDLGGVPLEVQSIRRHGSHLFLRYALAAGAKSNAAV